MKSDQNKEMDLLLRGHGEAWRRAFGASAPPGDVPEVARAISPVHLDADELNAYAENALPQPVRARYVAHLADCDRCRKLVTELTTAANVAGVLEADAARSGIVAPVAPGWRARLAALLAPRVLRYALLPVLALLFLGIIAFVIMRTRQDETLVATRVETPRDVPPASLPSNTAAPGPVIQSAPTGGADEAATTSPTAPPVETAPSTDRLSARGAPTGAPASSGAAQSSNATTSDAAGAPLAKLSEPKPPPPPSDEGRFAREPPPAETAQNAPAITLRDRKDSDVAASATPEPMPAPTPAPVPYEAHEARRETRATARRTARESAGGVAASTSSRAKPSAPVKTGNAGETPRAAEEKDERRADEESSVEMRSIAGRRFRRQGRVWLDTAYTAKLAMINIRRGSEQYRALVADEPPVGRIADQLGGEVIVVWKGRAYRIR